MSKILHHSLSASHMGRGANNVLKAFLFYFHLELSNEIKELLAS